MIRYLTAGESHGEALVGIVEGVPAGVHIDAETINLQLLRRWIGFGRGGRAKIEHDQVHIYSGVRFSKTVGSPIALRIDNAAHHKDKSAWPEVMSVEGSGTGVLPVTLPRPGHADLVGVQKYDFDDIRPVIERASARETAMRVACCTPARAFLRELGIRVGSHVIRIGNVGYRDADEYGAVVAETIASDDAAEALNAASDGSDVRALSDELSARIVEHIKEVKRQGDSLGGAYEVIVTGVPAGLGSYVHWDRKLDGLLAQAILSIQGQKAVEVGDGFSASRVRGSAYHDEIVADDAASSFSRKTNRAGGIEGGTSNGMPIVVRGYMKPIPTLIKPLQTVDIETGASQATRYERSDVTSVPAASTVAEAVVAMVIANAVLEKYGGDSIGEIKSRFV